jgi:Proton-conducting membrane transporter
VLVREPGALASHRLFFLGLVPVADRPATGTWARFSSCTRAPRAPGGIPSPGSRGGGPPVLGAALLIFLLSLAGIPSVAGFWAKLFVLFAATTSTTSQPRPAR